MKALIDTGVWFRFYHGLPLSRPLRQLLENPATEMHLCPLSVYEIVFKWQRKRLPPAVPDPDAWLGDALAGYKIITPTIQDAMQADLWAWEHGDPMDRIIAAVALGNGLTLVHTDERMKDLTGFPQMYFPGTN